MRTGGGSLGLWSLCVARGCVKAPMCSMIAAGLQVVGRRSRSWMRNGAVDKVQE